MLEMFCDIYLIRLFLSVLEIVYPATSTEIGKRWLKVNDGSLNRLSILKKALFYKFIDVTVVIEMH